MELNLAAKLRQARQNVDGLQGKLAVIQQQAAQTNELMVKWTGILEYLESLERDEMKPPEVAEGSGDGEAEAQKKIIPLHGEKGNGEGKPEGEPEGVA